MNARRVVRSAAAVADRLLPTPEGLVVLIYHRVGGDSDSAVDLPTDTFRAQMELLAQWGTVLPLHQAVGALRRGDRPTGVVITFDDGAADFCTTAVPIMRNLQLPSTLYLVTSAPDTGSLPWGVPAASWGALREATADGLVDVQSHTHRHTLLHHTTATAAADELDRSIDAISQQLGAAPVHFAYPKAVPGNRAARAAVAARFQSAALAGHRVNTAASQLQRLGRVPISRGDSTSTFAVKAGGGLRVEGIARHLYGRVRYRSSVT